MIEQTKTFRQLDNEVKKIANVYRIYQARKELRSINDNSPITLVLHDHTFQASVVEEQRYMSIVELAIKRLLEDERRIIRNDYFLDQTLNWWCTYYSRSAYYRFKKQALNKLIAFLSI